jgi:hypothetical protein
MKLENYIFFCGKLRKMLMWTYKLVGKSLKVILSRRDFQYDLLYKWKCNFLKVTREASRVVTGFLFLYFQIRNLVLWGIRCPIVSSLIFTLKLWITLMILLYFFSIFESIGSVESSKFLEICFTVVALLIVLWEGKEDVSNYFSS